MEILLRVLLVISAELTLVASWPDWQPNSVVKIEGEKLTQFSKHSVPHGIVRGCDSYFMAYFLIYFIMIAKN